MCYYIFASTYTTISSNARLDVLPTLCQERDKKEENHYNRGDNKIIVKLMLTDTSHSLRSQLPLLIIALVRSVGSAACPSSNTSELIDRVQRSGIVGFLLGRDAEIQRKVLVPCTVKFVCPGLTTWRSVNNRLSLMLGFGMLCERTVDEARYKYSTSTSIFVLEHFLCMLFLLYKTMEP